MGNHLFPSRAYARPAGDIAAVSATKANLDFPNQEKIWFRNKTDGVWSPVYNSEQAEQSQRAVSVQGDVS